MRLVGVMGGAKSRGVRRRKRRRIRKHIWDWHALVRIAVETGALVGAAFVAVIAGLGHAAGRFAGSGLWSNLLPFAGAVLALVLSIATALAVWLALRRRLVGRLRFAPLILALMIAGGAAWAARQPEFDIEVGNLRTLVGGRAEAEQHAIAHQVFAAYRRADHAQMQHLLERARTYEAVVHEAALAFAVDPEVLMGIGAAESSFEPRDSVDGGRGLFQITTPPPAAVGSAQSHLNVAHLDLRDPRHNAFVAGATLRNYLDDLHGDLFLALLAYNIGPHNGGLRAIMQQYGARDFVTIQPYLQHLPRDYPIRVLAAALAYRLWSVEGRLPRYEDADNAARIQRIGIPGLDAIASLARRDATPGQSQ